MIGVAIDIPYGPVVEAMMEHGFAVHSLNPNQLDRFRARFSPAAAGDDSRDALTLTVALRTDRRFFRRLEPDTVEVVQLREWTCIANEVAGELESGTLWRDRIPAGRCHRPEAFDPRQSEPGKAGSSRLPQIFCDGERTCRCARSRAPIGTARPAATPARRLPRPAGADAAMTHGVNARRPPRAAPLMRTRQGCIPPGTVPAA